MQNIYSKPRALALFSGGLDSILAALLVAQQGIEVTCLHYCTPFFGKPDMVAHWSKVYGLPITSIDISAEFVDILQNKPKYNFGKVMNPCVDCKILMLNHARKLLEETGACCLISGEVLGQRPMSQRKETLNIIRRDSGCADYILRPLCAQHLEPTRAERQGIIDRSKLLGFFGRGRKQQMALAKELGVTEIPTPAGGCRLADTESAKNYWPVMQNIKNPLPKDFFLANFGRQAWKITDTVQWLITGRNQADNDKLLDLAGENDILFKVQDFTGPIAFGRQVTPWNDKQVHEAAALMVTYSPKAMRNHAETGKAVAVRVHYGSLDNEGVLVYVFPNKLSETDWQEPIWEEAKIGVKNINRAIQEEILYARETIATSPCRGNGYAG